MDPKIPKVELGIWNLTKDLTSLAGHEILDIPIQVDMISTITL